MNINTILFNVAGRLGLKEETNLIKKSAELLRVLQSKTAVKRLSDYAKSVLCLDLSCNFFGLGFDKETAFLLSGLKKTAYQNHLNMLEKMLELDKPLSVSEVCVQFSCTVVKELSQQIIDAYSKCNKLADLTHPQYVAIAVYTACKLKSVKVQKSSFISISRLKQSQWKELEAEFTKFIDKMNLNIVQSQKKSKNELHEFLEENSSKYETNVTIAARKCEEIEIEDYDIWKARILSAAKQAILES